MAASLTGSVSASGSISANTLDVLQGAGITGDTLQSAITSLTGLNASAQSTVLGIAGSVGGIIHSGISMDTVAPLIAAGFAATGVGAPIAAAITLGLPLVEGLVNALDPQPKYQWYYRAPEYGAPMSDFQMGALLGSKAPWGPPGTGPDKKGDPHWRSFEQVLPKLDVMVGALHKFSQDATLDNVNPGLGEQYNEFRDSSHQTFGVPPAANVFRQVYNAAWRKNYEYILNGHNWVDPYTLLVTVANAWNATHAPTSTATFTSSMGPSYIGRLINGEYDQQDHPPITINTGAVIPVKAPPKIPAAVVQKAVATHVLTLHPTTHVAMAAKVPPVAMATSGSLVLRKSLEDDLLHWLPLLPAAAGLALFPWAGVVAPAVGGVVSALWWEVSNRGWKL